MLHGQAYHLISTLLPSEGKAPAHGQLYIYDPEEATEYRARADPGLRSSVLRDLHNRLITCRNPYVVWYKHLHEKVLEQDAQMIPVDVALRFRSGAVPDARRYNKPTCGEVAAVFVGNAPPWTQKRA